MSQLIKGDLGGSKTAVCRTRRSHSSNGNHYAVTIVYNRKEFTTSRKLFTQLELLKVQMTRFGTEWSDIVAIEIKESTNVLHLHTYCTCLRSPWVQPTTPWRYDIKKLRYDPQIWLKYITKHDSNKYAIEQRETLSKLYLTDINSLFL